MIAPVALCPFWPEATVIHEGQRLFNGSLILNCVQRHRLFMECQELLHGDITSISHVLAVICLTIVDIRLAIVNECLLLVIQVGHLGGEALLDS